MKDPSRTLAIVASRAGTGKTTLIEALVRKLKELGYRVGTVKHSGHDAAPDREGSDTWRFRSAGSDVTVLVSGGQIAVVRSLDQDPLETALAASPDTDIVLLEGFKDLPVPKIEVYRSGHSGDLYCRRERAGDPDLIAVASDVPLDLDVPVLDLNNPAEICAFIVERFGLRHR